MCGGAGSMPTPEEIGRANARYNRIDEWSPWSSTRYLGENRNMRVTQYSPAQQQLIEQLMGAQQGAMSRMMNRYGGTQADLAYGDDWPLQYPWADGPAEDEDPGPDSDSDDDQGGEGGDGDKRLAYNLTRRPSGTRVPIDPATGEPIGQNHQFSKYNPEYKSVKLPYDLGIDDLPSYEEDRARYEQAYMERARGLLDPVFADKQALLDQQMANRGMPIGTEETELLNQRLGEQQNDAYTKSALDAILAGGNEVRANRGMTLGERLAQFGTASQARNQLFGEDTMDYNQMAALLGMSQVGGMGGMGGLAPGNVDMNQAMGMYQQNQQFNAAQSNDFWGGMMGLVGTLGGAFLASDVRFKHDIKQIDIDELLSKFDDLDVSSWKYISEGDTAPTRIGPMAQNFNALFGTPSAVERVGYETIDMVSAIGVLLGAVKALKARVDELEEGRQ